MNRETENMVLTVWHIAASVGFGVWQRSVCAGVFAFGTIYIFGKD